MYKQPGQEEFLFYILYTGAAVLSLIASLYLWFRRANAIAPDVTSPVRLRRWTAALFASMTLSHVWYIMGAFLISDDDIILHDLAGGLLDSMTAVPLSIVIMFCMLQDRRRPLWPAWVMVAPLAVGIAVCIANLSYDQLPMVLGYFLLLGIGLFIYMVRAIRQYGRWLRDNYADLEHKEVWQSFLVMAAILLISGVYAFGFEWPAYDYVIQACDMVLVCYLLWRVETLSYLSEDSDYPLSIRNDIGFLLQQYCIDKQLYLQYDLNISQLAQASTYLSQYFSSLGTTYNAYINDLRINHFVSLYHEAVDSKRSITAQQLALESGYRSYSTFCDVIKRKTGKSVTAWMKGIEKT